MLKIIKSNLLSLTNYTKELKQSIINFCGTEGIIEDVDSYTDEVTSYRLYEIKENEIVLSRGLLSKLIQFLNTNNIKFILEEKYLENKKLEDIQSKIRELRPYQKIVESEIKKYDNGFFIIPTGGGKTVVMINEILQSKEKTFLLVHNVQLLNQFIDRLKSFTSLTEDDIGVYGDGKKEIKNITVGLMQSLGKLSDEEIQDITSKFDLFFIDETHHLVAETFLKITKNVKSKRIYGLTATPYKKNGKAIEYLEKILGPLITQIKEDELVDDLIILKPNLLAISNTNSIVTDMYTDLFSLEDKEWKVNKIYSSELLEQNKSIDLSFLPSNEKETTLIICKDVIEINKLYSEIKDSKVKQNIKIMKFNINKRNQSVLLENKIVLSLDVPEQYKRISMHKIKKELYYREDRVNLIYKLIYNEFKHNKDKDPYILVLSDTVEHLEFMYNNLPENLKKWSTLLHGKLKKKDRERIDEEISEKKWRVIFATDKFVGEGRDQSHLNVLILTHTMKDHEGLKQLVGRIVRSSRTKTHSQIYDIVDVNNPVTLSQFRKRYENYYSKLVVVNNRNIDFRNKIIQ